MLVNSKFTARVFSETLASLHGRGVHPSVLYPAAALPPARSVRSTPSVDALSRVGIASVPADARVMLSINRFERKKGLPLALRCLAELRSRGRGYQDIHLVLAGGYDPRLAENVEHLDELRREAAALGVAAAVTFVPSFSDAQKAALLAAAMLVLYTPEVRHASVRCEQCTATRAEATRRCPAERALRHGAAGGDGGAARSGRLRKWRADGEHRGWRHRLPVCPHSRSVRRRSRAPPG